MWLCLSDEGRNHMKVMGQHPFECGKTYTNWDVRKSKPSGLRNDRTVCQDHSTRSKFIHCTACAPKAPRVQELWGQGVSDASTVEGSRSRL